MDLRCGVLVGDVVSDLRYILKNAVRKERQFNFVVKDEMRNAFIYGLARSLRVSSVIAIIVRSKIRERQVRGLEFCA